MGLLNLNLKKRNRKSKSQLIPPHNNDTNPHTTDELNTIGCDFRASLLEDIMRELHSSSTTDFQRSPPHQKEERKSPHPKSSPASIFVSPSSTKRGSSGGVGPFLSPSSSPSVTPIATPFLPSSPITSSSSETNHNKVTSLNSSAHKGLRGRLLKIVEEEKMLDQPCQSSKHSSLSSSSSSSLSAYSSFSFDPDNSSKTKTRLRIGSRKVQNRSLKFNFSNPVEQQANNGSSRDHRSKQKVDVNNNITKSKEHELPPLQFDRLLRKELRLIDSRKKNYYSVPDLSILRHEWAATPQKKHEQSATETDSQSQHQHQHQHHHHHHHHHIITSNQCQSSFHYNNISQSNMYHHQSCESPCHLHSNQTNFEHEPKCPQPPLEHHHHHHHYHSPPPHINQEVDEEEKSKGSLDQSLYCHQHLPFMVPTCITSMPTTTRLQ